MGLLLCSGAASATVLMELSLPDLVAASDLVIVADVGDHWSAEDGGPAGIHTYTRIVVAEVILSGDQQLAPGTELVIQQEGGFAGDHGVMVPGNARLAEGERALLFLTTDGQFAWIYGMEQGKYSVIEDEQGIERVFRPSTTPVVRTSPLTAPEMIEAPSSEWNGVEFSVFRESILGARGGER